MNGNGNTYCCWNWKAGTTSGLIRRNYYATAYSISTDSGISIIKYTGNSKQGATLAHGLGTTKIDLDKQLNDAETGLYDDITNLIQGKTIYTSNTDCRTKLQWIWK